MREDALDVFFSYSHRDDELRRQLDAHLELLKRQDRIRTWYDGGIAPGQEIEPEIFARLDAADLILLLVSPDFIASDFCWSREMERAMERHEAGAARVIPILLRPVDNWHTAPFGKLEALPRDGLPATQWPDRDVAFRDVAAGIRTALEDVARRRRKSAASERPLRVVVPSRFGDRPEPSRSELVAKALSVYMASRLASRSGDRPESAALAEQVATALFNKGVRLGALGRSEEELSVYEEVASRFGDRPELALAEPVVSALGNKGWLQYELGDFNNSVVSSRAALARTPGATWIRCNLALALLHLGEIDAARETYAQASKEIETPEDFQRLVLQDLDDVLARRPDLPGALEIRDWLVSQRAAPQGSTTG